MVICAYEESEHLARMKISFGGAGLRLSHDLKAAGCEIEIRETILGHWQRGGSPKFLRRLMHRCFGVKAFECVLEEKWGHKVHTSIQLWWHTDKGCRRMYNLIHGIRPCENRAGIGYLTGGLTNVLPLPISAGHIIV
jgi:hypothetical protein